MPKMLSNAEKQKLYRERRDADPQKRAAYLARKKAKYQEDLEQGKRKSIKDLSDRNARKQRKEWKRNQRRCRLNQKKTDGYLTPPTKPDNVQPASSQNHTPIEE